MRARVVIVELEGSNLSTDDVRKFIDGALSLVVDDDDDDEGPGDPPLDWSCPTHGRGASGIMTRCVSECWPRVRR